MYHFSGLVFKFNFSFHKIFLSNIGKWTDFTRNWYLGQNFWTKVKISFLAKISNLLKFFRKSTCSSDKFPDLAFGPSNYLPNISHRQFSFRIVIKHLIKFCPASGSLRLSEASTVSQLSTRWQPNWSRAQQTSWDRYFPTMFRACLLPWQTLDGHRKRFSTIIIMTIQKSHKMLRCPAKLQSVVAKFSGQIFYKNKIFNFVFFEIVSVAFTFFLFKISTQFPMSRQIFLYLGVVPKWPRNLKNLAVFEHFGTNYLDIVVLLTRAQIWKTSSKSNEKFHTIWLRPAPPSEE